MKVIAITSLFSLCAIPTYASQAKIFEYRLVATTGGQEFRWSAKIPGGAAAKPKKLEDKAFLSNKEFEDFQVEALASPPSKPETYKIEMIHSDQGRKMFDAVANKDRERIYCVIIGNEIFQCSGFTPKTKGLWDKSSSIYGSFSKETAQQLVTVMRGQALE